MLAVIRDYLARWFVAYLNSQVVEVNGEYFPIDYDY